MRWDSLFADLEAQLVAAEAEELHTEVTDRTRLEVGRVRLTDRAAAARGADVVVALHGLGADSRVRGRLLDAGVDWLLVEEDARRQALVPLGSVAALTGLSGRATAPDAQGEVARRLDLRWALRGLVRDRAAVSLLLVGGSVLSGTLDRVGADHVDLAEHPPGEPRRAGAVRQVSTVPLPALAVLRSS